MLTVCGPDEEPPDGEKVGGSRNNGLVMVQNAVVTGEFGCPAFTDIARKVVFLTIGIGPV